MKEALRAQKNVGRFVGSEECNMVGRGGISRAFFLSFWTQGLCKEVLVIALVRPSGCP